MLFFFGSIQIIQYLRYNNVPITESLWLYGIHSNNAEIIHFLEEKGVSPVQDAFLIHRILKQSIICNHNDIFGYLKDNLLANEQNQLLFDNNNSFFCDFNWKRCF